MFLKEDNNFLNKSQISIIENDLLSDGFPYYIQKNSVDQDNNTYLEHIVLRRPEYRRKDEYYNSDHGDFVSNIVRSFCKKNKIKINEFFRISINFTFNNGKDKCNIHEDHTYPHKHLIVYLNDCDKESYTVIRDNKKEIKIKPKKYKGVCFESKPHYQYYPKFGHRVVLVCTFR